MQEFLYDSKQNKISICVLPDGKRDITILMNEREIEILNKENEHIERMFQYDGNQFRTIYQISEEEIKEDIEKYLMYEPSNEPSMSELNHDQSIIDAYTLSLIEEGAL